MLVMQSRALRIMMVVTRSPWSSTGAVSSLLRADEVFVMVLLLGRGDGGGCAEFASTVTLLIASTVTPSALDAADGLPEMEDSDDCTDVASEYEFAIMVVSTLILAAVMLREMCVTLVDVMLARRSLKAAESNDA